MAAIQFGAEQPIAVSVCRPTAERPVTLFNDFRCRIGNLRSVAASPSFYADWQPNEGEVSDWLDDTPCEWFAAALVFARHPLSAFLRQGERRVPISELRAVPDGYVVVVEEGAAAP